MAQVPSGKYAC